MSDNTHKALPRGIAIVGADCSGKTSLFDGLEIHFGTVFQYINSIAGAVINEGYPLGKNASKESYIELNKKYVSMLNDGLREPRAFVSDRSLIDAYCYALVNSRLPRPQIPDMFIDFLRQQWILELNFVEVYVQCIPEFEMKYDGKRVMDEAYQASINEQFSELLREAEKNYGTKVVKVRGSVEARVKMAADFISKETGVHIDD
ncbi:AAA family ATPase [uncultured Tateyamaria sp.]|uniref:AAA family ATPase n=1 Tax=uncultured Tateyamaria sp. TaxID=455651 RepID=UPI002637A150|nr:AAA family ATPase [uncultured Tateyamaria sp.]